MVQVSEAVRSCRSCGRGILKENGRVSCGAGVDDGAIDEPDGVNPIWAERKYGEQSILTVLRGGSLPAGSDCEDLDPNDGRDCKTWALAETA
jgi:hypothetical protein